MHKINPNVKILKQFSLELIKHPSLNLVIRADNKIDRKVCNKPVVPEIAEISPGDENSFETSKCDIIIDKPQRPIQSCL